MSDQNRNAPVAKLAVTVEGVLAMPLDRRGRPAAIKWGPAKRFVRDAEGNFKETGEQKVTSDGVPVWDAFVDVYAGPEGAYTTKVHLYCDAVECPGSAPLELRIFDAPKAVK